MEKQKVIHSKRFAATVSKRAKKTRKKKAMKAFLRGCVCDKSRGRQEDPGMEGAGGKSQHWQPEGQQPW